MNRLLPLLAIMALVLASVSVVHAQTTTPTVSTVAVTSDAGTDDTYALGDTIEVGLTFDEAVTVTGDPYLLIDVGGTNRRAGYHSGTGTTQLLFQYTVLAGDDDDDGIAVVTNSLTLNGGTIVATDDATAATLDHAALTTTDHKVDIIVTLLSNFGQPATSRNWTISATSHELFTFETGANTGGYQLESVALEVKSPSDTLQVEVQLHRLGSIDLSADRDDDDPPLATLTGSVTAAGRQVFTLNTGPDGSLHPGDPYHLLIVGSGTGTVELGLVRGNAGDSGGADGWTIGSGGFFIEGVDDPLDFDFIKVDISGHTGAIPYLIEAAITSTPLNGETYHAGEHIEIRVLTSVPVAPSDGTGRLPLWFGDGEEHYRGARLVGSSFPSGDHDADILEWGSYAVYKVRLGDVDTDGVMLDDELIWRDGRPVWTNALDPAVPVSSSMDFATVDTSLGHPVDGSQTWDCQQLLCAASEFGQGLLGSFGVFTDLGSISNRYFRYQDEEYIFGAMLYYPPFQGETSHISLVLVPALSGSEGVLEKGAVVFAGTVLPLRDAERFNPEVDSSIRYKWPYSRTSLVWADEEVSWKEGDMPLIKLIENVDVSFASDTYTVAEDGTVEVELTLSADLGRDVKAPITVVNQDGATDDDYVVPTEVTFLAGETTKSFVITPVDDSVDDDDETLKVLFGTLPENLSPGTTTETVVTILDNDDPQVEVNFRRAIHDVAEGADRTVTVNLTADPERTVVIPLTATDRDGATSADYAAIPASVTFEPGDTSKTFTFTATDDAIDDDGERVVLGFGTLPDGVTPGTVPTSTVSIIDDDAPASVAVSWSQTTYSVAEGGSVTVTAELDDDPEKTVVVPIARTDQGGAGSGDYSGVPATITFESGDTSKTFTFTATDDALDDDGESVQLAFGPTLPSGVTQGTPAGTVVRITDDDDPQVNVSYGLAEYTADEGGSVTVTVELDADPERTVVIPVTHTARAGATGADYFGVPADVTFEAGDTEKTFTFSATDDTVDDDDEEVLLGFGTLPTGVSAGTVKETLVRITDDDLPASLTVNFGADRYTVAEGSTVEVTVTLDEDPETTVVIPLARENLGGTSDSDYSGVPESVTFGSGDTSRTFTVAAVDDKLRDSGEELKLTFGTLPPGVSEGSLKEARVTITDSQVQGELTVGFGLGAITVAEGGTAQVTVSLSEAPGSDVTIPLTATGQDGATSSDYSGVPESVTFESSDTEQTFTFTAVDDTVDDDGESVLLAFGTLPSGVLAGTVKETLVSITDGDLPASLTVNFGEDRYTVAEGGTVEVTVTLDDDPERTVVIPVTAAGQDGATSSDYSGVPANVTFHSGDTEKSFTFTATHDAVDDDDESVKLTFGTLPTGVSAGTVKETLVSITDDDDPQVEVNFRRAIHDVAEGADRTVTVKLTADPERTVVVPLTATGQDGASSADYSVPNSVTFESGETTKDVTFTATQDAIDDDGEKVLLEFGTLPDGVTPGTVPTSTVSIIDDDAPASVAVSWAQDTYSVAEGGAVTVTAELDDDPEKTVVVPIARTNQGGAGSGDYSGVPSTITFESGDTSKSFTFTADDDAQDDDGESVQLAFGPTLPSGVTQGTPSTTTVSITDDDLAGDRLTSLVVAPRDIDGFDPEVTGYMVGVASTVTQATITATPGQTDSTVAIDGTAVTAGSAHAVDLSAGLNTFEVVVTSADNDQATYTVYIGRGTTDQGGWKAGDDLDTLRAAGNTEPSGIWANGTTVWIADVSSAKLYAYSQAGGARDVDKDIALGGVIMAPMGIWSDGATIWVIGPVEMTAFAYTLGSGARDSDSDISLGSDLMLPVDMWSDGVTMWVLDSHDDKLYAYTLSGGARDTSKDIDLAGENAAPLGVWSNGTTVWVTDIDDRKLYAYNFSGERVTGHDIDLHSRNANAGAIWGNGDTLWVANDVNDVSSPFNRVFTYNNVPVTVTFGQSSYTVAESDDTSTTEVAENAVEVKVTLSADPKRQVVVPITATRQGTVTGADYSGVPANLTFESGETEKSFTFTAIHDTLDDDDESVRFTFGMLPPGVTGGTNSEAVVTITDDDIGVSFERMGYETIEGGSVDVKVTLSSPATREVTILLDADKQGGASDDDYSGVEDSITFRFSDTETSIRFTAVDDELDDDGEQVRLRFGALPTGLVPGPHVEATITITDNDMPTDRLMSLVVAPKDIDGFDPEVTDYMVGVASTVTQATITATPHRPDDTVTIDGTTVTGGSAHTVDLSVGLNAFAVVVDSAITQVQSTYTVYIGRGTAVQGGWKAGDDMDTLRSPGNTSPTGAWSNGATMWIADSNDGKLYAYTLADGSRDSDKDITLDSNNSSPVGVWSNDTTIWVAELMPTERKVYAYTLADGSRDSDKDITLRGGNTTSWGLWSDGTTMWVVDWNDDEVYAYTLADDARDSDKDITLHGDNTSPRGTWSDGTTIWVVDSTGVKLYAYALSDGVRVEGYDIGLHSSNAGAGGIWANDDTAWVVNSATEDGSPFDRVFTYNNIPVEVSFQIATYTVAEGANVTITVTLDVDPERRVTIPITAANEGGATAADYSVPASVTFESGQTTRDVTFTAEMDDVDDDGESVLLGFGTTLPAGVTTGSPSAATVSITDDDTAGVTIEPTTISVQSGQSNEYTVVLGSEPTGDVTVTIAGHSGTDLGLDKTVLTFTADDWDTAQTVTVTAVPEATAASVTLSHSVSGGDYESVPAASVTVTIVVPGDELTIQVGVTTSEQVIAVPEGGSNTYSLLLGSRPASNVTISVSLPSGNDLSIDLPTLTFTTTNWATPQTVTLSASEDEDAVTDDAVLITHTMISGGSAVIPSLRATIIEKHTADLVITPTPLAVTEGDVDGATYTVALASEPTGDVTVTISGHSGTDLALDKNVLTFTADDWDSPQSVKATASHDDDAVDDPETLTHTASGADYDSLSKDLPVTITDDAPATVTVSFGAATYTVAEGASVTVTVDLDLDPERTVTIPITATNEGGATNADYSSVPQTVTFNSGDTSKTITFTATQDTDDDDGERVKLAFGALPSGVTAGTISETVVSIIDDDVPDDVKVSFAASTYTVAEGASVTVTVAMEDPEQTVTIPIITTNEDGATNADYSSVPNSVTFESGDTSKTFTFTATQDTIDDDGERVKFTFGALPSGVTAGTISETVVSIIDDDVPDDVKVSFGSSTYTVAEGASVTVTVAMEDPEQTVIIPITVTNEGGATNADYSSVPANVTFNSGDTSKTITFTATQDTIDDDGERVKLAFGTLPTGVTAGTTSETVVSITDDDVPDDVKVSFGSSTYTVAEGASVTVTVAMEDPEQTVTIPITVTNEGGATNADYSSVPNSVTFESGDTSKTFTFTATQDTIDDDGERVKFTFGALPTGVTAGATSETVVSITDDDVPDDVKVSFAASTYTVAEGASVTVTVDLDLDPERTVTIPITVTNEGGATNADYSSVPANVTFNSGDTSKTITFTATQDTIDDDGERVKFTFGALPSGVTAGTISETVVSITDDDVPDDVKVSFGSSTYTVAEGASVTVTVAMEDPEQTVTIPIITTNEDGATNADYSSVPNSVTFESGDTSKTFTFTATDDTIDDDGERVKFTFGALPTGVTAGTTSETVVSITDDDVPDDVKVSFGSSTYAVAEGASVTVTVDLDLDPERTVTIPITVTNEGGATNADYSSVPANVTFNSGDTSKTITFTATQDTIDDDGERVELAFGTLPTGVTAGATSETVVSITDDDVPDDVKVSFGSSTYTVAEGASVTVTVDLDLDPERTVTIPITVTNEGGATNADYSSVPANVTFNSGDTSKTFTFTATQDTIDDDGERVKLTFGALPTGVTAGTISETVVSITDDDVPDDVKVSFAASTYTVAEGASVTVTVEMVDPERTVTIPITVTNEGGATNADYSSVPANVTFNSGDTSKTITFTATQDTIDDDGERVKLAFGTLPTGVTAGTTSETVVSITDDDVPATVTVRFEQSTYAATEGGDDAVVTVILGSPAKSQVEIPLTANGHGGATENDWSGVPETVTFDKGDNSKSFTVTAVDDNVEDNGEMVELGFGTLPAGFAPASPSTARITLMNDNGIETTGQNRVCTKGEITVRGQTDRWVWRITDSDYRDEYTIDLMGLHSNNGTLRDPHIVYITKIYTHDGFYPPAGSVYGTFPSYGSNDDGVGWDSSSQFRFRNRTGSYSYFPGKEPELDTGYYTALVGANPFGDGANGLGSYTLCIEGPGSISAVDQPERRIVVSAAHVDVSDDEPAQFSIKLGARPTGPVEVFMTKLEPASDSQYVVEPLMHSFTVDNWDIPQVATVRRKADYVTPKDDGFPIHYWGKGGGYHKAFEFIEVYDRVPRWMTLRSTYDPEPDLTDQVAEAQKQNSPATGGPGIQGVARAGETLTATTSGIRDDDGLDNAVFAYQWVRSELGAESGTAIAGATGSSYGVTAEDEGRAITVRVTFTDDAGNEESVISYAVVASAALPQTRAPDPPGAPDVSPHDGTSLAVSWTAPASDGGSAVTGYKVQWKEAADSWDTPADVSEAAATGTSHRITGLTDGTEYSVRVLAINDIGEGLPSDDGSGTPRETVPPELSGASVDGATLTLTFNEALDEDSKPATTAFTVTVGGNVRAVDYVDVIGGAVTLTLASAVTSQDTVTVSYTVPASASAERLRDAVGNAAASFTGRSVTNDTGPAAPLTGSVHDAPESHNGTDAFTFELRFSETPRRGFSYETLRDHAFTVTGGEVVRAKRLERGKNIRWEITVRPNSNGAVTIVLPATTDCAADGAICTGDGRMLSEGVELVVSGPGG